MPKISLESVVILVMLCIVAAIGISTWRAMREEQYMAQVRIETKRAAMLCLARESNLTAAAVNLPTECVFSRGEYENSATASNELFTITVKDRNYSRMAGKAAGTMAKEAVRGLADGIRNKLME